MCCKAEGIWKTNASKYQKHKYHLYSEKNLNDKHSI